MHTRIFSSNVLRMLVSLLVAISITPVINSVAAQKLTKNVSKNTETKAEPMLTLEAISRDAPKWAGLAPVNVRWAEDGSKLYFQWNPERADRSELYEMDARSTDAKPRKIVGEEKRWLSANFGERNKADTMKVYAFQGDIYLHDLRAGKTRVITRTSDAETTPRFSADDKGVIYQRNDNLFEWIIETGETRQLTDFRRGKDPEEKPKLSKQDEDLEKDQLDMFEIVRKRDKNEKEQKEISKTERGLFPEATYLKENEQVAGLQLSPDRKYVTFILTDRTEAIKGKAADMPKYVTKSGYTEIEKLTTPFRVKVGAPQAKQKIGVIGENGKISYIDMGLDKRDHVFQMVASSVPDSPYAWPVAWSDDGKNAFCVLRAQDNKDQWIALLDVPNAKAKILDKEHDDAWMNNFAPNFHGWLSDNRTIWFRSERDGYFHIYALTIDDGKVTPLTSGKWEVLSAQLSKDRTKFYLSTSESHPGERHLYTMPVTGGARTRITTSEGVYAATLSPDEKWIAVSYGSPSEPNDLYLMENRTGAQLKRLTDSYTDEFKSYRWRKFDVVTIPDTDGQMLYARLYKPDKPDPLRPAVIYIHGAGYAQSVFKNWGGFNTTPFFNVLLQAGYTVVDLDYRGSSGYGRDCRTSIYRNMGGKDIDSSVAVAKWLVSTQGIDARRIGIYGGSYGGFFTLMAQFKHPGVFAAGAAMFPVTDWAHYNHGYTSNILNLPYEDEEAYRKSSPIHYAAGLQDRLLILHGMEDRNVHYQDTIRLTQKLIELKKTGWELATYPIEDHGWQNEPTRLDSNRRIFGLFEEVLKRPLPALAQTQNGTRKATQASK